MMFIEHFISIITISAPPLIISGIRSQRLETPVPDHRESLHSFFPVVLSTVAF